MAEQQTPNSSPRKTQARIADRERRRAQRERAQKLKTTGFVAIGVVAVLAIAYGLFNVLFPQGLAASPDRIVQGTVGPRLQVDREELELGHRIFNQPVRAAFNVKNTGDGTLKVSTPSLVTALQGC